ncbi:mannosyltransferase [Quaeritorhiza haematococci]|nr:mannosyltransferase [Quaeritorhiza haematococci]
MQRQDCDEVFNYWEPNHYLQYGWGLQTWEYSPLYAIRSWAYIGFHTIVTLFVEIFFSGHKVQIFYVTRALLGLASAACEAYLYSQVIRHVGPRVGRYLLFILFFSTGMFIASTAYLPSTFAMYTTTLALATTLEIPGPSSKLTRIAIYKPVLCVGLGALLGWPFSGALAVPIALIILFTSLGLFSRRGQKLDVWRAGVAVWFMVEATLVAVLVTLTPILLIDRLFYRKWTLVPYNIVSYNVFSDHGPDLYGTEPWHYYLLNGFLNFNFMFLVFLGSAGAVLLARLLLPITSVSRPTTLHLIFLLSAPYIWLAIFTVQPHKEERFLFVVYPLLCVNAAVGIESVRRIWERCLWRRLMTYTGTGVVGRTAANTARLLLPSPSTITKTVLVVYALLSISRTWSLYAHYSAPMEVYSHFTRHVTATLPTTATTNANSTFTPEQNLCLGKEWYRFPSHYFIPSGVRVRFLKSEFRGLLPKYFAEEENKEKVEGTGAAIIEWFWSKVFSKRPRGGTAVGGKGVGRPGTYVMPSGMNDLNQEEMDRYIDSSQCDYLIDVDFPSTKPTTHEPAYIRDTETWSKVVCVAFLDAARTSRLGRAFWVPEVVRRAIGMKEKVWGDYCLLERKKVEREA